MHHNKLLYNKTNQMHQFPKFIPAWNSTCFGQFLCPSSGVHSPYIRHWYMSYRFEDSFRAGPSWSCLKAVYKPVWHNIVECTVNKLLMIDELSETCRVSCQSKFVKLVHLVGFIIKTHVFYFTAFTVANFETRGVSAKCNVFFLKENLCVFFQSRQQCLL